MEGAAKGVGCEGLGWGEKRLAPKCLTSSEASGRTVLRGQLGEETGVELQESSTLLWSTCTHSPHRPSVPPRSGEVWRAPVVRQAAHSSGLLLVSCVAFRSSGSLFL